MWIIGARILFSPDFAGNLAKALVFQAIFPYFSTASADRILRQESLELTAVRMTFSSTRRAWFTGFWFTGIYVSHGEKIERHREPDERKDESDDDGMVLFCVADLFAPVETLYEPDMVPGGEDLDKDAQNDQRDS